MAFNSIASDPSRTDVFFWLKEALRRLDELELKLNLNDSEDVWQLRSHFYCLALQFGFEIEKLYAQSRWRHPFEQNSEPSDDGPSPTKAWTTQKSTPPSSLSKSTPKDESASSTEIRPA